MSHISRLCHPVSWSLEAAWDCTVLGVALERTIPYLFTEMLLESLLGEL